MNIVAAIIIVFVCLFISFLILFKRNNIFNFILSILIPIYVIAVAWINIPCLISFPNEEIEMSKVLSFVFKLYNEFDIAYVIIANIIVNLPILIFCEFGNGQNTLVSKKKVCNEFNNFCQDATELLVLGNDLDFLLNNDYEKQLNKIKTLKDKCTILCQEIVRPDKFSLEISNNENKKYIDLVQLYNKLLKKNVNIKCYSYNVGEKYNNLRKILGQIKTASKTMKIKIVSKVDSKFKNIDIDSIDLAEILKKDALELHKISKHPVIKCIAIDLAGVAFSGKIEDFYDELNNKLNIKLTQHSNDKVNLDDDLSLGNIQIHEYIRNKATKKLNAKEKNMITKIWNDTWKPNEEVFKIIEKLENEGYDIVFMSNIDTINGDYFKTKNYFGKNLRNYRFFFSCEEKICKPDQKCFEKFQKKFSYLPCQILLIDDQTNNLEKAQEYGWHTLKFDNTNMDINVLENDLKKLSILNDLKD